MPDTCASCPKSLRAGRISSPTLSTFEYCQGARQNRKIRVKWAFLICPLPLCRESGAVSQCISLCQAATWGRAPFQKSQRRETPLQAGLGKLRHKWCLAPNPPPKQKQCDSGVLAQAPIVTQPPPRPACPGTSPWSRGQSRCCLSPSSRGRPDYLLSCTICSPNCHHYVQLGKKTAPTEKQFVR